MKKYLIIIIFIFALIPFSAYAEDLTYSEATSAVKQSIQAWYMRGANRQYNSSKNTYSVLRHPEDSTSQDTGYSVCSGFTNDVWMEAFGFKSTNDGIGGGTPAGSSNYCIEARHYLDSKDCQTSTTKKGCKGEFLVYYENKGDNRSYFYNPDGLSTANIRKFSNFLKVLQPGDIVSYNGHVVIIYDFKYDSNGNRTDALFFESRTRGEYTKTKVEYETVRLRKLYYYRAKKSNNNLLDLTTTSSYMPYEGTVTWRFLSAHKQFVKDGKIDCQADMCSITRAYYKGSNNEAVFNYDVEWPQQINTSKARNELPGIFIQKTSSKNDNDSVVFGNSITYTIRIQNNSDMVKVKGKSQGTQYKNFHVVETLPSEVSLVAATVEDSPEGNYDESNRTVSWNVSSLDAGEMIILRYKVKVDKNANNLNKTIKAKGKVYKSSSNNYITTGTVQHEIIRSKTATDEDYLNCYNKRVKAGDESLNLIQNTYECVYGTDLGFSLKKFSKSSGNMLDKLIEKPKNNPSNSEEGIIQLNTSGDRKIYADMILNNYWGGLVITNDGIGSSSSFNYYLLPRWRVNGKGNIIGDMKRAKTITSSHFKTGDVLIYYYDGENADASLNFTKENGLYAYIFLNGSFVGINNKGKKTQRNTFTKEYYSDNNLAYDKYLYTGNKAYYDYANYQTIMGKDSYVILRPEKVITEVSSIKVKQAPNKVEYYQNKPLDLTGGIITATINDGTTQDISMTSDEVTISGYDASKVGEQSVSVSYGGKSTHFTVTVNELTVNSISVYKNPTKMNYYVGETLNLTGGVIKVIYSDNSTTNYSMKSSKLTVTGFDSTTSGTKTITFSLSGKTTTIQVQVEAVVVSTISIEKYPNKLIYLKGENLDLTGGKIQKKYNNSTTESISMTDSSITVSGYNKDTEGTQTITLSTDGKTVTFDVVVNTQPVSGETKVIDSIVVYCNPSKINYHLGEELDLTGGKIRAKYIKTVGENTSIEYEIIDMTNNSVTTSGFSSSEEGSKTITVSYQEKTTSFTIQVSKLEKSIKKIEITTLPKKKRYIRNQEFLALAGARLTIKYLDNTTEEIELPNEEVNVLEFDNTKLGEQEVIVVYQGLETNFPVTVYEEGSEGEEDEPDSPIESIEIIDGPSKTNYLQDTDAFDVTGINIRIKYENGEERDLLLEDYPGRYEISGYDNKKAGEQTVTITYRGYPIKFKINVIAKDLIVEVPDTLNMRSIISTIISIIVLVTGIGICIIFGTKKHLN